MTTLFNRLKNDILTSIQEDGGISGGMDEEQFEAMLDEAIYEETHVTVIIHVTSEVQTYIESNSDGFFWDYQGIDKETGYNIGTLITPNDDGDYVIEGVSFGTYHIYPSMNVASGELYQTDRSVEVNIDKNNYEFTMTKGGLDVPTQQEI